MPIEWREQGRQLHLYNERVSYIARVLESGTLAHLYFGSRLATERDYGHFIRQSFIAHYNQVLDPIPTELPTAGSGDFRIPGLSVRHADGSTVLDLVYREHAISAGKPPLDGLPSTYVEDEAEAETVEITLVDGHSGLRVQLLLTVFTDRPVVARSMRVVNGGGGDVKLTTAMSAVLDLPDRHWNLLQLSGDWARETHVIDAPLVTGSRAVRSQRGSSGHQQNPFILLRRPATTEADGEAVGLSLVYSGNFLAEVEVDPYDTVRARIGLDPETVRWQVAPGMDLQIPEAVLAWSDEGIGGVSDAYHRLYRERLASGSWRDAPRPVLFNSWEGAYYDFDEDTLVEMAAAAKALGAELFVLDDGWFGQRDDDTSSLGDWTVDLRKLPSGLPELVRRIEDLGLLFGIWIEPEMVSPRSRLFDNHPEWAVGVPGRPRSELRNQYVLDLSNREVVDYLERVIGNVLSSAPIGYVKWDHNRVVTEPYGASLPPERQNEFFHRYTLGLYDLYSRLTERFPEILFESCAGGGGRNDPGMLAFAPQAWISDATDAVERQRIQYGTSLVYPLVSMGAHVTAVPNHQVGRVTPLATRAAVAVFGNLGYELDPRSLSAEEAQAVRAQIAWYKERRALLHGGRFHRLLSPFEGDGNETAWMVVDDDGGHALVGWYRTLSHPLPGPAHLRLRGLEASARYEVSLWPEVDDRLARANAMERGGDELMHQGLFLDDDAWESQARGDFGARLFELRRVST
ncbi:MAG: alpha-galactosidase [Candidatus Limnocylindrales bacterium]